MSTTSDMLGAVQKSASLHKEEMLKMKEIATTGKRTSWKVDGAEKVKSIDEEMTKVMENVSVI